MRKPLLGLMLLLFLGFTSQAWAGTLWLGTDNTNTRLVLHTDLTGTVIGSFGPEEASGIAIDPAGNLIYIGTSGGLITSRNLGSPGVVLASITPGTIFGEDMAFDGTNLWRVDILSYAVDKIDPATGAILQSFPTGFQPLGIAWDGKNLWVSAFAYGGMVEQFTTGGAVTGNFFLLPGNVLGGGLAYDTTDGTLFVGTWDSVYHVTTSGTVLGSFNTPDVRFVDGLEFQPSTTVPEPGSMLLLGSALMGVAGTVRRRLLG